MDRIFSASVNIFFSIYTPNETTQQVLDGEWTATLLGSCLCSGTGSRVVTIDCWPLISSIDQDGQRGQEKERLADPHRCNCLGSLTNPIAYQGAIMGTNG